MNLPSYKNCLRAGWRSALVAAGINIAWLFVAEFTLDLEGLPKGFPLAVVFSSMIPMLPASLLYVWLRNSFQKGLLLYWILSIAFAVFSIFPSFQPILPDGNPAPPMFAVLTVPMHLVAAWCGTYYLIRSTEKGRPALF